MFYRFLTKVGKILGKFWRLNRVLLEKSSDAILDGYLAAFSDPSEKKK